MVTVVFYSTSSCGYCRPVSIMLDNMRDSYGDNEVTFTKMVVDIDPGAMQSAREFSVNAVPTILIIANQEEKERLIGDITHQKVFDAIERYLQPKLLSEESRGSK